MDLGVCLLNGSLGDAYPVDDVLAPVFSDTMRAAMISRELCFIRLHISAIGSRRRFTPAL